MMNPGFTELLLALLAILLVAAAVIDVRTFTISNGLNAAIALMAPLYWWSIGLGLWPDVAIQLVVAVAVFLVLAATFYLGMMGGGDVKMAAAIALWFPPLATLKFLVVMSLAGGVVTLIVLLIHKKRGNPQLNEDGKPVRPQIPYGVAIAAGALWILAQRFLNQFA